MRPDLPISLGEFRAWLDGYSEGFDGGWPNEDQWYQILDRLDQVSGTNNVFKAVMSVPPTPGTVGGLYQPGTINIRAN